MKLRGTIGWAAALAFAFGTAFLFAGANDPAYRASVEKWRQNYEASLKSDDGWLSVAGLF